MEAPENIRQGWQQKFSLRSKEWTTMRPLHQLQKWTPSALFWLFPHPSTGRCITWMLIQNLCMEIFMKHPEGYITDPYLFFKLKKSLHGLKQAPREWYSKMDAFLLSQKFQRCRSDPNVYLQQHDCHLIIIVLYVDDLLIAQLPPFQPSKLLSTMPLK